MIFSFLNEPRALSEHQVGAASLLADRQQVSIEIMIDSFYDFIFIVKDEIIK